MTQTFRGYRSLVVGVGLAVAGCSEPAGPTPTTSEAPGPAVEPAPPPTPAPTGLNAADPAERVAAIRRAMGRPEELGAVAPRLTDPDADVRRAAILAVGPAAADGPPGVGPEALFPCLHDPDRDVRDLAVSALKSRGLDAGQIELARLLVSPDAADRLQLLHDLATDGAAVTDPGPWLERLSRDPEPAVRAGTARVAHERRLRFTGWLDRLADRDPDPTVRQLAGWYRGRSAGVRQAGFADQ